MEMILSGSDLYLVYVEGHRLKSNLEACTSVWASVVISIPDCLRLMYLGYLKKYVVQEHQKLYSHVPNTKIQIQKT